MSKMHTIHLLFIIGAIFIDDLHGQDSNLPTDILQSYKTTLEAAGSGSVNIGPMGLFGNVGGQFGVKINKEETTSGGAAKLIRNFGNRKTILGPKSKRILKLEMKNRENSLKSSKDVKSCGSFGFPLIFPVVRIIPPAPTTTTTAAGPDVRS